MRSRDEAERELVRWYLATFAARTGTADVLDALPEYRVPWSEVLARGRELEALPAGAVDARFDWHRIRAAHRIAAAERRIIRAATPPTPSAAEILS